MELMNLNYILNDDSNMIIVTNSSGLTETNQKLPFKR